MNPEPLTLKLVTIYTDGACTGNPGPGGWAAVLTYGQSSKEISGYALATTNNRMELQASIEALRALKHPCRVDIHTDSQYLRKGIKEWIRLWKLRGWRTMDKQPVKNEDLWRELDKLVSVHKVHWHWTKGHAGDPLNERCDALAREQVDKCRQRHPRAELKAALVSLRTPTTHHPHSERDLDLG